MVNFRYEKGDLFKSKNLVGRVAVQCIPADFAIDKRSMTAGIAKVFTEKGVKADLCDRYENYEWHGGDCLVARMYCSGNAVLVANLITKPRYYDKPCLKDIRNAIHEFVKQLKKPQKDLRLIMPLIACGLDQKNNPERWTWKDIESIISEELNRSEISADIIICYL